MSSTRIVRPYGLRVGSSLSFPDGAEAFDPSGTPYAWFAADAIVGLSADDPVGTWLDLSANGNDLTQATGSKKPLYKVNAQNGLPGVFSDGSAVQNLNITFGAGLSQPNTIFLVFKHDSFQGGLDVMFDSFGSGNRQAVYTGGAFEYWYMYAGLQIISTTPRDGNAHILTASFNGASSSLRLDGSEILTGNIGTNVIDGIVLFNSTSQGDPYGGHIFEVIFYNEVISPDNNEAGLMTKWGVS